VPNKCGTCSKSDWSSSKRRIERKTMADSAIVTRGLKKQFGKKMEFGPDKIEIEQIRACGSQVVEVIDLSLEESFVEYVSPYLAEEG
jgi:hypothetical protein